MRFLPWIPAKACLSLREVLLLSTFVFAAVAAVPARATDSVRDAALQSYIHGITPQIAAREVGAEGIEDLRSLLTDPAFPRPDNVVAFLAMLGEEQDVELLMDFLENTRTEGRSPEVDRALLLVPDALGEIARRGGPSAFDRLLDLLFPSDRDADPALQRDLAEMALFGLARSQTQEARDLLDRLERSADSHPLLGSRVRSLASAARLELDLRVQADEILDRGESTPQFPGLDGGLGEGPWEPQYDLDAADRVHESGIDYSNHVDHNNPIGDARVDDLFEEANLKIGRDDYSGDTACCATLERDGSGVQFGSPGDGLDIINDGTELNQVLGNNTARVKVVRSIRFCGGPGTNILGCAATPGSTIAVVRLSNVLTEAVVWAHEYGHNTGSGHSGDNRRIMFGSAGSGRNGVSEAECGRFHNPPGAAQMTPVDIGACTDFDADDVHDVVDNCPNDANKDQTNADGDPAGAACDCNDSDPATHPGASEICKDGVDQDCDGRDRKGGCGKTAREKCRNGVDDDADGLTDCADPDCSSKKFCL